MSVYKQNCPSLFLVEEYGYLEDMALCIFPVIRKTVPFSMGGILVQV